MHGLYQLTSFSARACPETSNLLTFSTYHGQMPVLHQLQKYCNTFVNITFELPNSDRDIGKTVTDFHETSFALNRAGAVKKSYQGASLYLSPFGSYTERSGQLVFFTSPGGIFIVFKENKIIISSMSGAML